MKTFDVATIMELAPAIKERKPADAPQTAEIPTGERNPTFFKKGAELKDLGYNEQEIFEMLSVVNETRCPDPLDDAELKTITDNIFEYANPLTQAEKRDYAIRSATSIDAEILERLRTLDPLKYPQDDKGLAQLFADTYKRKCRFNATENEWDNYTGNVWKQDPKGMMTARYAKEFADAMLIYGTTIEHESTKKHFINYANKTTRAHTRETMIRDARECYHITKADLDKNDKLFNCQNGTFNLETFKLQDHNPDDLISKISNVFYKPEIQSKDFEKFIWQIMKGNKEKIRYLQKAFGYALTADTLIEACFILYGATTRNGKSTLVETIGYVHGDTGGYAMTIKPETLATKQNADSRQANNDIARLDGCRFLNAAEPKKNMIFDSGLLKQFTGRDTITARHLYQAEFQFVPKFKLFMNTNFLPSIKENTLFTSKRINVITFDRHFEPHEQDPTLKDRLKEPDNISGIFNWCLEGLRMFRAEGLTPPECVINATADYEAQSDKIGNFWDERLEKDDASIMKGADVYEDYQKWCIANGYQAENKGNFFEMLKNKNLLNKTGTIDSKTERNVVKGYKIKPRPIVFRGNV